MNITYTYFQKIKRCARNQNTFNRCVTSSEVSANKLDFFKTSCCFKKINISCRNLSLQWQALRKLFLSSPQASVVHWTYILFKLCTWTHASASLLSHKHWCANIFSELLTQRKQMRNRKSEEKENRNSLEAALSALVSCFSSASVQYLPNNECFLAKARPYHMHNAEEKISRLCFIMSTAMRALPLPLAFDLSYLKSLKHFDRITKSTHLYWSVQCANSCSCIDKKD